MKEEVITEPGAKVGAPAVILPDGIACVDGMFVIMLGTGDKVICETLTDALLYWNVVRPPERGHLYAGPLTFEAQMMLPPWHPHRMAPRS